MISPRLFNAQTTNASQASTGDFKFVVIDRLHLKDLIIVIEARIRYILKVCITFQV